MSVGAVRRLPGGVSRWVWAAIDAAIWAVSVFGATWLRYEFDLTYVFVAGTVAFASVAVLTHLIVGSIIGPYGVGHQRGSFEEVADLGITFAVTTPPLALWALMANPIVVPRSVPLIAATGALMGMFAARFLVRTLRTRHVPTRSGDRRVIVFGAGDSGRRLVRSMLQDRDSGYLPVAFLDDDRTKRLLTIDGVPVRGTRDDMGGVAVRLAASTLVIALPQAESSLIIELSNLAEASGLDVLVLPPLRDTMNGQPGPKDLRDLNLSDLLGRRPVTLDLAAIADQLAGQTVLVTGAGGSIGSELCRQIVRFGPKKLYLLDRDESGLQGTQVSLTGRGLLDDDLVRLADIRDLSALRSVFAVTEPDIVFHAAALKHLPLLESYPLEGWKTNVLGTYNVLTASAEAGVRTFVNISTDKAANPTSVLGMTKRLTERLTADFARTHPESRYVSVRFGNVLGSRGSVVHLFTAQIGRGGPVTVTHPDVERFFMLIPEACQLVLEAASIGANGEVMVLEMGEQVKIVDVARTLIKMSGRSDIDIVFTGLRHGEKLSEELFEGSVEGRSTSHALVTAVSVPPIEPNDLLSLDFDDHAAAAQWMREDSREDWRVVSS